MKTGRTSEVYRRESLSEPMDEMDDEMDIDRFSNLDSGVDGKQTTIIRQGTTHKRSKRKYPELAGYPSSKGLGKRVRGGDTSRNVSGSSTSTQAESVTSTNEMSVHMVKEKLSTGRNGSAQGAYDKTRAAGSETPTFEDFNLYSEDEGYYEDFRTSQWQREEARRRADRNASERQYSSRR